MSAEAATEAGSSVGPSASSMPIASIHQALTAPGAPFEMEIVEIDGRPTRAWKGALPSMRALLELSRTHGEATFIVYEDERYTYAEFYARAAAFARALTEDYGVGKGDRVAIAMRNFPEWPMAFFGAVSAGAIVVPLNAWWTGPELLYGLTDSGSTVLVADGERVERLRDDLPGLSGLRTIVVRGEVSDGTRGWEDVVGDPDPANPPALPEVDIAPGDDATIMYTSGTTGRPKGALGTHRNFTTNVVSMTFAGTRAAMRAPGFDPTVAPVVDPDAPQLASLISVPLFHATGSHSVLQGTMLMGSKLVMMYKWNAERALELIEREQVSSFGGVPSMVWQVLESPDFDKRDLSSVQTIGYGGAPAPPELVRRIDEMFPGRVPSNGYGLTETSSMTTSNGGTDYLRKPDSVGVPVAVCEVKVVDALDNELPQGEVGELWIAGPNVVRGYWGKPEATEKAFTAGWLRTGDVARIDEEGFVFIVDRAKDMIIRGGENVYCSEIEAVLFEHPGVFDAAVIPVPHQVLGEEVGTVVQLKPGQQVSVEEIRTHVRGRLAGFKVPEHVWFRNDDLPRNPAGKILKRDLREELVGR
ncbi:class I adenylate-forming enzyme family protein [Nocardioides insulae]|uniref:class I adenylate-forming enzyme family protein n=1 Tax=Nocardioides insulae TaxID=394734 RepID=UPI0004073E2E|nr:class I adenylate-forming enzyme family protein [Nocardioides insulae]